MGWARESERVREPERASEGAAERDCEGECAQLLAVLSSRHSRLFGSSGGSTSPRLGGQARWSLRAHFVLIALPSHTLPPAMTSADHVQLRSDQVHVLRRSTPAVGRVTANKVLKEIRRDHATVVGEVADLTHKTEFDWRRYLAGLPLADFIIGQGVVRFTVEIFPIKDPNHPEEIGRGDFVVHCVGGRCVRLHPHSQGSDAQPIVTNNVWEWRVGPAGASSPSIADSQAASSQWVAVRASAPDIPCTVQFLRTVAQVDRIGKRCATEFLDAKAADLQARSQWYARLETTEHFTRRSFSLV